MQVICWTSAKQGPILLLHLSVSVPKMSSLGAYTSFSGQDIKKNKWQICTICENMLIMKHVPHLSMDKEGKKT